MLWHGLTACVIGARRPAFQSLCADRRNVGVQWQGQAQDVQSGYAIHLVQGQTPSAIPITSAASQRYMRHCTVARLRLKFLPIQRTGLRISPLVLELVQAPQEGVYVSR